MVQLRKASRALGGREKFMCVFPLLRGKPFSELFLQVDITHHVRAREWTESGQGRIDLCEIMDARGLWYMICLPVLLFVPQT